MVLNVKFSAFKKRKKHIIIPISISDVKALKYFVILKEKL